MREGEGGGGREGVEAVSRPIITIHSKDDLPRPSLSTPRRRRSGMGR